jgi:hypothetical protein
MIIEPATLGTHTLVNHFIPFSSTRCVVSSDAICKQDRTRRSSIWRSTIGSSSSRAETISFSTERSLQPHPRYTSNSFLQPLKEKGKTAIRLVLEHEVEKTEGALAVFIEILSL